MNWHILLARRVWRVIFYVVAVFSFLVLFPIFYIIIIWFENFKLGFKLKIFYSAIMLSFSGIRYSIKSESKLKPNQAYIFCPNHSSYLDIILAYQVIPVYFLMIGKAELKRVPLFNIFFKKMNISVDRNSKMDSHRAFVRSSSELDKGTSLVMFPEGTIPNNTPKLGRFKNGPFKLAIAKQIPIVPVTFLNNWQILPDGRKKKHGGRPKRAKAIVHAPIETKGMTENDLELLKAMVYKTIDNALRQNNK